MSLIFISHSSQDNAVASELRERLFDQGYSSEGSIFLDFAGGDGIKAGQDWEQTLYRTVRACRALIVLCSRTSMASRWCFMEITHARALGKHLFPVKIDDCTVDGILTDHQLVDLTKDAEEGYRRLLRGIAEAGLDPRNVFQWDGQRPPYPGLMAFQEADAGVFFGREEEIAEGLDLLNRSRRLGNTGLVMVLGASGSGKSSVVRAGLVPRLRRDVERWLVVDPFRPQSNPEMALADVLTRAFDRAGVVVAPSSIAETIRKAAGLLSEPPAAADTMGNAQDKGKGDLLNRLSELERSVPEGPPLDPVRRHLRLARQDLERSATLSTESSPAADHENPLVELLASLRRANRRDDATILLIVDQFEELLDRPPGHSAHSFLRLIRSCIDRPDGPLLVIGTLRSDFLGSFQKCPALADLRFETLSLRSMSHLGPVITAPAEVAGIELESGLAETLMADAHSEDALPLLAFTLRELYDRTGQQKKLITRRDYNDLGRLEGAVAQSAGQLVATLNVEKVGLLRQAMLRLARITDEGGFARRVVPWSDLDSRVHPILQKFVEARLLVADEKGGERVLEVAHEALFRSWDTLRGWLNASIEELHVRKDVEGSAAEWDKNRRSGEYLWRGGRLARLIELKKDAGFRLGSLEADFLTASQDNEQAEKREDERRRKRQLRWTQLAVAVVSSLLIAAVYLYYRANEQQNLALARQLASESVLLRNSSTDWTVPALLAMESLRRAETVQGYEALWRVNAVVAREIVRLTNRAPDDPNAPHEFFSAVAFSPDGTVIASGSNDRTVRLFETRSGRELTRLMLEGRVVALAFSPDGTLLATATDDNISSVFELRTQQRLAHVAHQDLVTVVTFSRDGKLVATGSRDKNARVFAARSGQEVATFALASSVLSVAFSPDGTLLATGSADFAARIFDIRARAERVTVHHDWMMIAYDAGVNSVAFSPDGKELASGSENDVARVFDVQTGKAMVQLSHQGGVSSVAYSSDGERIATGSADQNARVFSAATGRELSRLAFQGKVLSVAFSPDGTMVAAGSEDGSARVFEARNGRELTRLASQRPVSSVVFSPDGALVAAAGPYGATRIFQARPEDRPDSEFKPGSPSLVVPASDPNDLTVTVKSPGGRLFAVLLPQDKVVRIVDAQTRRQVSLLKHDDIVLAASFSPDGSLVVTSASDAMVRVFESSSGRLIQEMKYGFSQQVAFSPDGKVAASGSLDGTVRLFVPRSGRELARIAHQKSVSSIAFSPDGTLLATGSEDTTARVFLVPSGREVARMAIGEGVLRVEFSEGGRFLRTTAGTFVLGVGGEGSFLTRKSVEPIRPSDLISAACKKLDRNLTQDTWTEYLDAIPYRQTCSSLNPAVAGGKK